MKTSKASAFLSAVLGRLDEDRIAYCVERNYEGYPAVITGDIDLIVTESEIQLAAEIIIDTANKTGWRPFIVYLGSESVHLGFFCDCYQERFVLVFECFAGGGWRGMRYLSARTVVEARQRQGMTWKPHPAHEAIITMIHHLLYNGKVFEKYRSRILHLVSIDTRAFRNGLKDAFGTKLAKRITDYVINGEWQLLECLSSELRISISLRFIIYTPIKLITRITRLVSKIRRKPCGVSILIEDCGLKSYESLADEILSLADLWHIFIPPNRCKYCASGKYTKKKVDAVLASGGVAVIVNSSNCSEMFNLAIDYTIQRSKLENAIEIRPIQHHLPISIYDDTNEIAMRIWFAILANRSEPL